MTSSGSRLLVLFAFVSSASRHLNVVGSVHGGPLLTVRPRTREGDQTQSTPNESGPICPFAKVSEFVSV